MEEAKSRREEQVMKTENLGHSLSRASYPWAVSGDLPLLIPGLSFERADAIIGF